MEQGGPLVPEHTVCVSAMGPVIWCALHLQVRSERNRARDEVRQLRQRLDSLTKELTSVRRDRQELASENETLRQEMLTAPPISVIPVSPARTCGASSSSSSVPPSSPASSSTSSQVHADGKLDSVGEGPLESPESEPVRDVDLERQRMSQQKVRHRTPPLSHFSSLALLLQRKQRPT